MLGGGARLRTFGLSVARAGCSCAIVICILLLGSKMLQTAAADGDTRTISLHHIHTNEDITITYKRNGQYDEAALEKLNWFLRDWRREQETRMDPHLIDLIWEVHRETGSHEPVWVVCGYRSPETNAMLRRRSHGVARFSQHILGHAIDFFIPGVPLEELRVIGLRLQRGGVGFYPTSGSPFVHMDTGGVRHWPRMTREQLVRIFPDGRTVHIPSDGRPLPGYALALADIEKRGGSMPSGMSLEAARRAGIDDVGVEHRSRNLLARLFGFGRHDEDEDDDADAPAASASSVPTPAATEPLHKRAKAAVVAFVEDAEDKLAAEKSKLVQAAAKAHAMTRAGAAAVAAALTPNQIIAARGYWQGPPDGTTASRSAAASVNALAAVARPPRTDDASVGADTTGSLGPFHDARDDHVPLELALAYAEQAGREAAPRAVSAAAESAAARPRAASVRALAVPSGENGMTIAVKRVEGRPASAIFSVANKATSADAEDVRFDDPWLRAVMASPSVRRFLTVTALGRRDFRSLAALMVKPASAVMMTFSANPQLGLTPDHFSGSAIVFMSTVTYPTHTAELQ